MSAINKYHRAVGAWAALVVLLLVGAPGCGNDSTSPVAPATPSLEDQLGTLGAVPLDRNWVPALLRSGYELPDTPDQAVANFMDAYGARQFDPYRQMLHADYRFVLLPQVVEDFGLRDDTLDVKDEVAISWRIFHGGISEFTGRAIDDVSVDLLDPREQWQDVPADDPHFGGFDGAQMRTYQVNLSFEVREAALIYQVVGPVTFYVAPVEVEVDGAMRTVYQVLGQVDHTDRPAATEGATWSQIKAYYWNEGLPAV